MATTSKKLKALTIKEKQILALESGKLRTTTTTLNLITTTKNQRRIKTAERILLKRGAITRTRGSGTAF